MMFLTMILNYFTHLFDGLKIQIVCNLGGMGLTSQGGGITSIILCPPVSPINWKPRYQKWGKNVNFWYFKGVWG